VRAVNRTPLAAQDYRSILDYLLERSEPAAIRFNEEVELVCRLLVRQPRMGRARDDLLAGLRSIVVGHYVVFFRPGDDEVQILRIIHGARNITPDMFAGG
jgi:toxin ParE1/3/4